MNIFQLIKAETQNFAHKTALIEDTRTLSYAELISAAQEIAGLLKKGGVAPFQRVGLLCGNSIDYIAASLAILSISAVAVPVSADYTAAEIEQVLNEISADFLLFKKDFYPYAGAEKFICCGLSSDTFFIKKIQVKRKITQAYYKINPAFIRFSSGTTDKSKGVVLSHETIMQRTEAADKGLRITSADSILWVLSMSFHFVVSILLFLRRAATIILCHHPFPDSLVESITKYRATVIYASPFHYDLLTHSDLLSPESLLSIRLAVSTTIKLSYGTASAFFQKFGFELAQAYGIIEVGLPFINLSANQHNRNSVGKILPDYEIKIVDQDASGVGRVYVRGKGMLDAYFSPWQNREAILEDGWFITGDLGKIDETGFLTIVGRKQNVINFIGIKIFPFEVEAVLNQYSQIYESLVYGKDHPKYGQLPVAKIVLKNGLNKPLDLQDLRRFCYKRLAPYKVPKQFVCVNQLPKTASGKIRRQQTSQGLDLFLEATQANPIPCRLTDGSGT